MKQVFLMLRWSGFLALMAAAGWPGQARAVPLFAHRYGVSCQTCHSIVPRLNGFGESFKQAGYRWPGAIHPRGAVPLSMKVNLADASSQASGGLPKAIVDEVEFLMMGSSGRHLTYRVEQYLVDGGVPGRTRDAYLEYRSDGIGAWQTQARPRLDVQIGQFTLPLPNDPETQRPTENHYAIFDQTVGSNPFNLFDDRAGINIGASDHGVELRVLALANHDGMAVARLGTAFLSFSAYRYGGTRALGPIGDAFTRNGFALTSIRGRARTSLLLQTGNDSSADGLGTAAFSSGGYVQEEWSLSSHAIGAVRYDGVNAPNGFLRSTTLSLILRPTMRSRFTIEDVLSPPGSATHGLSAAWLFAY